MADLIPITGLDETLKALRALPTAISGKNGGPLRKALFASAKVVQNEIKQMAPVRTGLLKNSIALLRDRNPQNVGANEHYTVWVRGQRKKYKATAKNLRLGKLGRSYTVAGAGFYARFLEFGTSKMAAHPFFRPAFEASKSQALQAFQAALAAQVDKAVELAKRGGQ